MQTYKKTTIMKKTLLMIAVCAMFFVGCQEEKEGASATHYYTISTNDMSWGRADMNYIADFFTDEVRMFTVEGTTGDADREAMKRYNDILSQIDDEAVCSQFPCEYDENLEEYLYYQVYLLRTEGMPDTLAGKRWSHDGTTTR